MNYVYLKSIDDFSSSNYIHRLNYIVKKGKCQNLYNYTKDNLSNNLVSDIETTNYWANFFSISTWYKWIDFEIDTE